MEVNLFLPHNRRWATVEGSTFWKTDPLFNIKTYQNIIIVVSFIKTIDQQLLSLLPCKIFNDYINNTQVDKMKERSLSDL